MSSGALLINHALIQPLTSITYFGSGSRPVDSGAASNTASPMTIVPPAGMMAGDLVYVNSFVGSAGPRTFSIPVTGGQSWTTVQDRAGAIPEIWRTFCTFNGTWSANPQFAISGTAVSKTTVMHVFRPPYVGGAWAIDQESALSIFTGIVASGPSIVNVQARSVSICYFNTANIVPTSGGANWSVLGSNQYRNFGPNARCGLYSYQIQGYGVPVGATGSPTKTNGSSNTFFMKNVSYYYV